LVLASAACTSAEDPGGAALVDGSNDGVAEGAPNTSPNSDGSVAPPPSDAGTPDDSDAGAPPEQTGEATYYNATGTGSCGVPFPSDYLVAAMNQAQYQKSYCGKCVSVTGPNGTVVVRILDLCPGCKPGGLDLSETAFKQIADLSAGRVPITWHFVSCPF
jgi:expansin (peptidoglycan-binding protein)